MSHNTHSYVGSLACGCGVAIVVDEKDYPKDTANTVAEMIRDGYTVQRFEHAKAVEAFQAHCVNYPHEAWQKRDEAARIKRLSVLPLESNP